MGALHFDGDPGALLPAYQKEFTMSDMFRGAVTAARLPAPRVEGLGGVRVAHLCQEVRP